jgi:hypothetical protein
MSDQMSDTLDFPHMQPEKRLQELILYVANRLQGDLAFGRVKLAKILYCADFTSYRLHHMPVTGSAYVRWEHGPVPQNFLDILDEMESARHIVTKTEMYHNHQQKRVIALREPDLTLFSGRDIKLVDDIIEQLSDKNASELSHLSHGVAWGLVGPSMKIPYEASLLSDEALTKAETDYALQLAREYNLE